jgi:predicted RNase H-like HicB family nuclease
MTNTYTAIVKQDGDWWIGWVEEVAGVNCQEKSRDELIQSLKVILKEALVLIGKKRIKLLPLSIRRNHLLYETG